MDLDTGFSSRLASISQQLISDQIAAKDAIGSLETIYQALAEQIR